MLLPCTRSVEPVTAVTDPVSWLLEPRAAKKPWFTNGVAIVLLPRMSVDPAAFVSTPVPPHVAFWRSSPLVAGPTGLPPLPAPAPRRVLESEPVRRRADRLRDVRRGVHEGARTPPADRAAIVDQL